MNPSRTTFRSPAYQLSGRVVLLIINVFAHFFGPTQPPSSFVVPAEPQGLPISSNTQFTNSDPHASINFNIPGPAPAITSSPPTSITNLQHFRAVPSVPVFFKKLPTLLRIRNERSQRRFNCRLLVSSAHGARFSRHRTNTPAQSIHREHRENLFPYLFIPCVHGGSSPHTR